MSGESDGRRRPVTAADPQGSQETRTVVGRGRDIKALLRRHPRDDRWASELRAIRVLAAEDTIDGC
jgi:hypothetical protein